jgi:hypothetical protein
MQKLILGTIKYFLEKMNASFFKSEQDDIEAYITELKDKTLNMIFNNSFYTRIFTFFYQKSLTDKVIQKYCKSYAYKMHEELLAELNKRMPGVNFDAFAWSLLAFLDSMGLYALILKDTEIIDKAYEQFFAGQKLFLKELKKGV